MLCMLDGSKTVMRTWTPYKTEGNDSEHSRGEDGTFLRALFLLYLCCFVVELVEKSGLELS